MPNTLIWIPKRLVELGLVNVAARSPEAFIDYCEQDYAARVEHAAACVRESGAHVVMLTGPSASGKTTTAHKLADCIAAHGRRSAVVSLDNFYKDLKDYPRLPDGSVDYESVDALDISAINRCLLELIRTGRTQIPDFDFCGERRRHGVIPVEVGDGVVVIEGIHALNPRLTALLPEGSAFKIYAGMREEYSRDGQRILPTRDCAWHAAWCGTTSSAATAWKRLFPCGPPSARERIRTSRFSNPKQTCCWIPAFPTRCAVLRLLSPRCGVSLRLERLMRRSWKACAAVLHCACRCPNRASPGRPCCGNSSDECIAKRAASYYTIIKAQVKQVK